MSWFLIKHRDNLRIPLTVILVFQGYLSGCIHVSALFMLFTGAVSTERDEMILTSTIPEIDWKDRWGQESTDLSRDSNMAPPEYKQDALTLVLTYCNVAPVKQQLRGRVMLALLNFAVVVTVDCSSWQASAKFRLWRSNLTESQN
jgi:hypothetical protein